MIINTDKLTNKIKEHGDNVIKEAKGHGSLMDLVGKFKWVLGGIILTIIFPKTVMYILVVLIGWYLFTAYYEKNKASESKKSAVELEKELHSLRTEMKHEADKRNT